MHRVVRAVLLAAALAFVALSAYEPHWRPSEGHYRFPVHLDEYWHWGMATAVGRTGQAETADPFTSFSSSVADNVAYPTQIHERGFHAYLAALQATTGIEWVVLMEFLPTIVALLSALAVYALAQRWDAGLASVLWLAAIPTSLRFLGPGFVVPISFAMPLALIGFLVATRASTPASWLVVMAIAAGLWPIHAMGALILTALVAGYLLAGQVDARAGLLAIAIALPFLLAWPIYVTGIRQPLAHGPTLTAGIETLRIVGPLFFLAGALGAGWLLTRRDPHTRAVGVAFSLLAGVAMAVIIVRIVVDIDPLRIYDRAVTTLTPLVAVLAGAGSAAIIAFLSRVGARTRWPRAAAAIAVGLVLVAQGAVVAAAWERNVEQPYYRPLTEERYAQYAAVKDQLPRGGYALVDSTDTLAFTAITGLPTAYVQTPEAPLPPPEIQDFFAHGSNDTKYLVVRTITTVVTDQPVTNPDLVRISPSVYVLRADIVARMLPR